MQWNSRRLQVARWKRKSRVISMTSDYCSGVHRMISENGRGGRKVERKGQHQGQMEQFYESSHTAE